MSKTLELGRLGLNLPKNDLQLSLLTTSTFSHPTYSSHNRHYSQIADLDWDTVRKCWVERGNGLTLELVVRVHGRPIDDDMASHLSNIISQAQLWSQLGLVASPTDGGSSYASNTRDQRLSFLLTHTHSFRPTRTDCVHRICYGVPPADIAPPENVQVLKLMSTTLIINIKSQKPTSCWKASTSHTGLEPMVIPAEGAGTHDNPESEERLLENFNALNRNSKQTSTLNEQPVDLLKLSVQTVMNFTPMKSTNRYDFDYQSNSFNYPVLSMGLDSVYSAINETTENLSGPIALYDKNVTNFTASASTNPLSFGYEINTFDQPVLSLQKSTAPNLSSYKSDSRRSDSGYSTLCDAPTLAGEAERMLFDSVNIPEVEDAVNILEVEGASHYSAEPVAVMDSDKDDCVADESPAVERLIDQDYKKWLKAIKHVWEVMNCERAQRDAPDLSDDYEGWLRAQRRIWRIKARHRKRRRERFDKWRYDYVEPISKRRAASGKSWRPSLPCVEESAASADLAAEDEMNDDYAILLAAVGASSDEDEGEDENHPSVPECLPAKSNLSAFSTSGRGEAVETVREPMLCLSIMNSKGRPDLLRSATSLKPSSPDEAGDLPTSISKPKNFRSSERAVHTHFVQAAPIMDTSLMSGLIDGALRLSIQRRSWKLMPGLKIKNPKHNQRLHNIAPSLWSPGFSQTISTRAPLLPTISHALSRSVFRNAKSPILKAKLERLISQSATSAKSKIILSSTIKLESDEKRASTGESLTASSRFEAMSAILWKHMQHQLMAQRRTHRLKPLGLQHERRDNDDNEDLFCGSAKFEVDDDFMFDEEERDIWDEDDALFDECEERNWYEFEDDLFEKEQMGLESEDDIILKEEEDDLFEIDGDVSRRVDGASDDLFILDNDWDMLETENKPRECLAEGDGDSLFRELEDID